MPAVTTVRPARWSRRGRQPAASRIVSRDGDQGAHDTAATARGAGHALDRDGDNTPNLTDNCPDSANPDQADRDNDGIGDTCDPLTYQFAGFFSPVDNLPTVNLARAGSAIPVRFGLGGDHGLDVFTLGYPRSQQVACDSTAPVDGIEETVTAGGGGLSYAASTDRYAYGWKTEKAWTGTCRQLVLRLADGSSQRAGFSLR